MNPVLPPSLPCWDVHCHTEFAHCASTVTADAAIAAARAAGLDGLVLTEHAFALYVTDPGFAWSWQWRHDPSVLRALWASGRGRMDEYRAFIAKRRAPGVLAGIELDLLPDGTLSLAPEDAGIWDVRVGAVHVLSENDDAFDFPTASRAFMEAVEGLVAGGIDVLAHPFRWFVWKNFPLPKILYDDVVALCRRHGVAAEINTHAGNVNDPDFFRRCLDAGVRIACGTDAHAVEEMARMDGHAAVLASIGVPPSAWREVLYRPTPRAPFAGADAP